MAEESPSKASLNDEERVGNDFCLNFCQGHLRALQFPPEDPDHLRRVFPIQLELGDKLKDLNSEA